MLRTVIIGLGPIGTGCARAILAEADLKLVGLLDIDPVKHGRTASELCGVVDSAINADDPDATRVTSDLDSVLDQKPDVAVVTTTSRLDKMAPLVQQLLARGVAVLSSCEELVWPWYRHDALARELDAQATKAGRAVLGVGVNPGFAMDMYAVSLATMLRRVTAVRCVRCVNTAVRRPPLQRKLGATMQAPAFREKAAKGEIGHVGLAESVALLAAGLGRCVEPGSVEEKIEPMIAQEAVTSAIGLIGPGEVTGVHQVARWRGHDLTIELDLRMAVGLAETYDRITLEGPVRLCSKIPGGIPGDSATVAALVNHVRVVHEAKPGLRTLRDVPVAGCGGRDCKQTILT